MNKNDFIKQIDDVLLQYPELEFQDDTLATYYCVKGRLSFIAVYNDIKIEDSFLIQINIPKNFPKDIPVTFEIGERIPHNYHKFNNGILCLGAPLAQKKIIHENPTILSYINDLVIPYLFTYRFKEIYHHMPYGELPHGEEGIISFYSDFFGIRSKGLVVNILLYLSTGNVKGHHLCPCNSGKKARDCHIEKLLAASQIQSSEYFKSEWEYCSKYLKNIFRTSKGKQQI